MITLRQYLIQLTELVLSAHMGWISEGGVGIGVVGVGATTREGKLQAEPNKG